MCIEELNREKTNAEAHIFIDIHIIINDLPMLVFMITSHAYAKQIKLD